MGPQGLNQTEAGAQKTYKQAPSASSRGEKQELGISALNPKLTILNPSRECLVGWAVLRGNFASAAVQLSAKPPASHAKVCNMGTVPVGQTGTRFLCPFQGEALRRAARLHAFSSQIEVTLPREGTGFQALEPLTAETPNSACQLLPPCCSFPGLQECGRAVTLLPLPSVGPDLGTPASGPSWPEGVFPLRLTLGTATGSRAEAGHSATSPSPRAPQNSPSAPAPGLGTLTATACPVSC